MSGRSSRFSSFSKRGGQDGDDNRSLLSSSPAPSPGMRGNAASTPNTPMSASLPNPSPLSTSPARAQNETPSSSKSRFMRTRVLDTPPSLDLSSSSASQISSPLSKSSYGASRSAQEQIVAQWDLNPRKRNQTPVSEAKFNLQLEKVLAFVSGFKKKKALEEESRANESSTQHHAVVDQEAGKEGIDFLSPDFDKKRQVVVRENIDFRKEGEDEHLELPTSKFQVMAQKSSGSYSPISLEPTSAKPKAGSRFTFQEAKYSHPSELDEIEVELSFLLQSATNSVVEGLTRDVLDKYLDILVFFGSRSGMWCRHALAKLAEHLEIESIGAILASIPLTELELEDALEGVWNSAEKVFSTMMRFITLDRLLGNLTAKCTPRAYENIVKMVYICLPLESTGAGSPGRLASRSAKEIQDYLKFLLCDLWNLHATLHPIILERLNDYINDESTKKWISFTDLSGLSPHTLVSGEVEKKYLRTLLTLQPLDSMISLPKLCKMMRTAKLKGSKDRLAYVTKLSDAYYNFMNFDVDVLATPATLASHPHGDVHIRNLVESYNTELGKLMGMRHAILMRLSGYLSNIAIRPHVAQILSEYDVRKFDFIAHYTTLKMYSHILTKNSHAGGKTTAGWVAQTPPKQQTQPLQQPQQLLSPPLQPQQQPQPQQLLTPPLQPQQQQPQQSMLTAVLRGQQPIIPQQPPPTYTQTPTTTPGLLPGNNMPFLMPAYNQIPPQPQQPQTLNQLPPLSPLFQQNPQQQQQPLNKQPLSPFFQPPTQTPPQPYPPPPYQQEQEQPPTQTQPQTPTKPASVPYEQLYLQKQQQAQEDKLKQQQEQQLQLQLQQQKQQQQQQQKLIDDRSEAVLEDTLSEDTAITPTVTVPHTLPEITKFLRSFDGHVVPAFLRVFSIAKMIDLPDHVSWVKRKFMEMFVTHATPRILSRLFDQFLAQFFIDHYADDVTMSAIAVVQSDIVLETIIALYTRWTLGVSPAVRYMAFRRLADYLDDETARPIAEGSLVNAPDTKQYYKDLLGYDKTQNWDILELYIALYNKNKPHFGEEDDFADAYDDNNTNYDEDKPIKHENEDNLNLTQNPQMLSLLSTFGKEILRSLLQRFPLQTLVPVERIEAALRNPEQVEACGEFFKVAFNLEFEYFARAQYFAELPTEKSEEFADYLKYIIFISKKWASVKLLVLERLRVYIQSYSSDVLLRSIVKIDPISLQLSDLDITTFSQDQKRRTVEDLAAIFTLWDFDRFYPANSDRTDMSNLEFLRRKAALLNMLWEYYEFMSGVDWVNKVRGVAYKAWSLNIWLYNWPSNKDQALLSAITGSKPNPVLLKDNQHRLFKRLKSLFAHKEDMADDDDIMGRVDSDDEDEMIDVDVPEDGNVEMLQLTNGHTTNVDQFPSPALSPLSNRPPQNLPYYQNQQPQTPPQNIPFSQQQQPNQPQSQYPYNHQQPQQPQQYPFNQQPPNGQPQQYPFNQQRQPNQPPNQNQNNQPPYQNQNSNNQPPYQPQNQQNQTMSRINGNAATIRTAQLQPQQYDRDRDRDGAGSSSSSSRKPDPRAMAKSGNARALRSKTRTQHDKGPRAVVWHELSGHPGVMWTGTLYKNLRVRFLKAADTKDLEAVMGTVGSDIPSHAMWHYVNNMDELKRLTNPQHMLSDTNALKWTGYVMPVLFIVGDSESPYHPVIKQIKQDLAMKKQNRKTLMCGFDVEPINFPTDKNAPQLRYRGVTGALAASMNLFADTAYSLTGVRYATYLARHMWTALHAWAFGIYVIAWIWNIVQCSFSIDAGAGKIVLMLLWLAGLLFISVFVEISVSTRTPTLPGVFQRNSTPNILIRAGLGIVLVLFGIGQNYYIEDMVKQQQPSCSGMSIGNLVMFNFLSAVHILVRKYVFRHIFNPERGV